MEYFLKKLLGHEIFKSMVSRATNLFFEKFVKPFVLSSSIINVRSLKNLLQNRYIMKFWKAVVKYDNFLHSIINQQKYISKNF